MMTSSEVPIVSIILLTEELLPLTTRLVATYLWPEQEDAETSACAEANLRQLLAWPGAHLFLAISSKTGIGFAVVYWGFSTRHGQPILCIQDLFVLQQARRRGVARMLLHHLALFARSRRSTASIADQHTQSRCTGAV